MPQNYALLVVPALAAFLLGTPLAARAETKAARRANSQLELVLHYDFFAVEGACVRNAAGKAHDGTLLNGEIVPGKRKPALKLDGRGALEVAGNRVELTSARRAFSVGALCRPATLQGVVLAKGDERDGFSLYLQAGVPCFAVRSGGELIKATASDPVGPEQWVHLLGTVSADGQVQLLVNGWPVAKVQGKSLAQAPDKPLSIGRDSGGPVGDYQGPASYQGLLEDVRFYWGVLDRNEHRDELADWADLPGCGCKK